MIYINSTNVVSLTAHQDSLTGTYIDNATVTAAILDGNSTLYTVSLDYVAASSGNYRGTFSAAQTTTLTDGRSYIVEYVATSAYGKLTDRNTEAAGYV